MQSACDQCRSFASIDSVNCHPYYWSLGKAFETCEKALLCDTAFHGSFFIILDHCCPTKIRSRHTRLDRVSRKPLRHWIPAFAGMTVVHRDNLLSRRKYLCQKYCMIRGMNTNMKISSDSNDFG